MCRIDMQQIQNKMSWKKITLEISVKIFKEQWAKTTEPVTYFIKIQTKYRYAVWPFFLKVNN